MEIDLLHSGETTVNAWKLARAAAGVLNTGAVGF
jgi:hypothetical protein